jgi:hypothetical protein
MAKSMSIALLKKHKEADEARQKKKAADRQKHASESSGGSNRDGGQSRDVRIFVWPMC